MFRYVRRVPNLLGDQATFVGKGFHRAQEPFRAVNAARCQFVVGALASQQRPPTANSRSVEGRTIFVLAVSIIIVAMPRYPGGRLHL